MTATRITQCDRCEDGQVYDPTMADRAGTDGSGLVQCSRCRGAGEIRTVDVRAEMEHHLTAVAGRPYRGWRR